MMVPVDGPILPIDVSLDDPEPLYRQIVQQIRSLIVSGSLEAGQAIPSVRGLARQLECSVITTRRAYQELEAEGFIRSRQGMATTVAPLPEDVLAKQRTQPVRAALRNAIREAHRAGIEPDELLTLLRKEIDAAKSEDLDEGTGR